MFAACAGGAQLLRVSPRLGAPSRRAFRIVAWTSRRRAEPRPAKPATETLVAPSPARAKPAAPKPAKRVEGDAAPKAGSWTVDEASHRLRVDRYLRQAMGGASQKSLDRCAFVRDAAHIEPSRHPLTVSLTRVPLAGPCAPAR